MGRGGWRWYVQKGTMYLTIEQDYADSPALASVTPRHGIFLPQMEGHGVISTMNGRAFESNGLVGTAASWKNRDAGFLP